MSGARQDDHRPPPGNRGGRGGAARTSARRAWRRREAGRGSVQVWLQRPAGRLICGARRAARATRPRRRGGPVTVLSTVQVCVAREVHSKVAPGHKLRQRPSTRRGRSRVTFPAQRGGLCPAVGQRPGPSRLDETRGQVRSGHTSRVVVVVVRGHGGRLNRRVHLRVRLQL